MRPQKGDIPIQVFFYKKKFFLWEIFCLEGTKRWMAPNTYSRSIMIQSDVSKIYRIQLNNSARDPSDIQTHNTHTTLTHTHTHTLPSLGNDDKMCFLCCVCVCYGFMSSCY